MNKRLKEQVDEFIYHGEKTPISIGTIVICFLCLLFLIVATFTQLNITHVWPSYNELGEWNLINVEYPYVPQIPVVIFIAALLGPGFGLAVILMYLIMGFFIWPVFALGGGLDYIKSGLFGYILGYIFAVIPVGKILQKNYSLKNITIATLVGVLTVHICGAIYCILLALLKFISFSYVQGAIDSLGGIKTLYDIIITFFMLLLAIPVKKILWIAMRNSSILKKNPKPRKSNEVI